MNVIAQGRSGLIDHCVQALDYRPGLSIETLAFLVSLFFSVFSNLAFWHAIAATSELQAVGGWITATSLFIAITALNMLLLCVLLNRWTAKPVLTVLLLVTAAAAHYMNQYTVYLDADMIRNILHTDSKESGELITSGLIAHLMGYGVLPSILVWRLKLSRRTNKRAFLVRGACLLGAALVVSAAALFSFQNFAALMRNHKEVRHLITPGNYLVSLGRVAFDDHTGKGQPLLPIGVEARVVGRSETAKPRLLVLVVGETVRAQNWGLNGYARQTTPELQRIAPINFSDITACGSSTEVSVPCMFSPYGRAHYDKNRIERSESLLHVLEHAGIRTSWRDNQTGCKRVCDGLAFQSFEHDQDPQYCNSAGCLDEVMLQGLAGEVAQHSGDQVIVLHQLGNHGPSYFQRYPPQLRRFTPTCDTSELGQCSPSEIINAYDNAVLYTDHFLARTIQFLAGQTARDTAMIYLSDHGESLGENGLYLHGVPYAIAPDHQTKVPMVMWISPGLASQNEMDLQCMGRKADSPASQDNLFHSVLGLMQVKVPEYNGDLDLFRGCMRASMLESHGS